VRSGVALLYEGVKGHCEVVRGCIDIPLSYVYREHEGVTAEQRAAEYPSADDRLATLVVLTGDSYQQDNARVWDLLRPLVYGTPAWSYVKQYDARKNGRMAFRVLQRRGEGESAKDARRAKAEEIISKAKYSGTSKRFTLNSLINLLQGAFTDMEECGEPVSPNRQVDIFCKAMQADRLKQVRIAIMQSADTRSDFTNAYTFVETMEKYNQAGVTSDTGGFDRNVSHLETAKGGNADLDTSYRNSKAWNALDPAVQTAIRAARDKDRDSGKGKGKGKGKGGDQGGGGGGYGGNNNKAFKKYKRKLSKIVSTAVDAMAMDTSGTETASGNDGAQGDNGRKKQKGHASDQFGRHAHALAKMASSLTELNDGGSSE
jgi:hypothetical protein